MKIKETEAILEFIKDEIEHENSRVKERSGFTDAFKEGYASACRDVKIIANADIPDPPPKFINVEFLMALHPELSKKDAESLRMFSSNYEIKYIEQYAGSIMYPMWEKECKQKP